MIDHRIETFLCVCEKMNYTEAARALNMTQPAVSQHVRALEKIYDCRLFTYEQKRLCLTQEGELLRKAARAVCSDEAVLRERLAGAGRADGREYRIGATMTVGEHALIKPLAAFLSEEEDVHIELAVANTDDLLAKLRRGRLHFAIVEGYFPADEFDYEVFSTEKYIPVCSAKHRFDCEPQKLKDLTGQRLIMREKGSGTRDVMEKNLQAHGLKTADFARQMEVSSLAAIVALVCEGCGITFLYEAAARREIEAGRLREIALKDFVVEHDFTFVWNRGSIYGEEYKATCRRLRAAIDKTRG